MAGRPFILALTLIAAACASGRPPDTTDLSDRLRTRTGAALPPAGAVDTLPPGLELADGLTQDEAVALALWNNPDFQVQLTDLGFARTDLLEAGLLTNPILSLLFPIGPKQLEATLKWPIQVLWERPRRLAAARTAADRVAAVLEQSGLTLASDVKIAYAELALAEDRARLATLTASELAEISRLTQVRLDAGDISELEARTAAIEAARAQQDAVRTQHDVALRANELRARLGLALNTTTIVLSPAGSAPPSCGELSALTEEALASRPDVRAAELAIESAGARLGWERSRIIAVTAVLDANGRGTEGFEMGPGVEIGVPLFDRNQGPRARAGAELERATRAYAATRQRIATEVRDAGIQLDQANTALTGWRDTVLTPLDTQVRVAESAFADGEVSYLFVLETTRRRTEARLLVREAEAGVARAIARMERAVGRRCGAANMEPPRGF